VAEGTGIFRFAEQAGTLFLGTYNLGFRPCEKCPLVYSSLDGKNWKVVPNSPINNDNHQSVSSLLVSSVMQNSPGSKLYVGTKNDNDSGWLILYQYGPSPGNCIAHAVKTAVHDLSSRIGNIQQVLERCAVLPCLYERPPLIRPIPPVDDLFPEDAFETPLVNEIMEAVEYEMQASPDDDDLKDQVVEHLAMVRGKLIQALYPFHNNFTGDDVFNQTVDWSVVDEAIVGLDVAQEHCHKASILLSHMSGGKGPRKSR
jgi:hypothetical protein